MMTFRFAKRVSFLFLLSLASHALFAQGVIKGVVTDSRNRPLSDVNITIETLGRVVTSDKLGRFVLRDIRLDTCKLTFSSVGFRKREAAVVVTANEPATINVVLEEGELMLADVVITDQLGAEINTISQVDIKLRPVNTSQDILRMMPGIFIAQHAGGGKAEQIFLRGFDVDHGTDINLEVDGLPVNMVSHAHGQGYSDLHFVIPELIGTVDFNAGPYYADKGNFATAGHASFHTRNFLDQNMVKVEGARFGSFRNVNAVQIHQRDNQRWTSNAYVASEYFRTDGFFENHQHFNRLNLMGKYNAFTNDGQALTIGLSTFNSRWDASGQIPVRAVEQGMISRFGAIDPTEGGETSRTNAWIKHLTTADNGEVFENQLYYSKYDFHLVSNFTFFLNDPVDGDQITQEESRHIFGYRGSYFREVSIGPVRMGNEVGIGLRHDDIDDIALYRTRSRRHFLGDLARGDVDETNLYAYLSETFFMNDRLSINAAVRFDHLTFSYVDALEQNYQKRSISKSIVTPKLTVHYGVSDNVNLFVKAGIGYHANDTRVVVAREGHEVLPRAYGVDAGANFKLADNLLLNTTVWILDMDQEFVYVGDEGVVEPSGETRRKGFDLSMRYQVLPWLYFDADVNLTDPRAKGAPEGQHYIPLAPRFTTIGGVSCRLDNGINGSLRYRYLKDRPANELNTVVADGYFLMDAVLKYTRKSFEFSLSAENLLNARWREAQFDTESRLQHETEPVSEIHFTPGTPFFLKAGLSIFF